MKSHQKYFHFKDNREVFEFSFLSGLYGVIFLGIFFRINFFNIDDYLSDPGTKRVLFITYLLSWLIFPLSGIGLTCLLKELKEKYLSLQNPFFYSVFIFFNFLYVAFLIHPNGRLEHGWKFLLIYSSLQLVAIYSIKKLGSDYLTNLNLNRWIYIAIFTIAIIWFSTGCPDFRNLISWTQLNILAFISIVLAFHFGIPPVKAENLVSAVLENKKGAMVVKDLLIYISSLLVIFILIFNTNWNINSGSYSYYLGPLADLMGGKSLLVNINAQYGVLIFYFLKFFFSFVPLGWTSFCYLNVLLQIFQYFIFYFIACQIFAGKFMPLFSVLMLILINNFGQVDYFSSYPSSGPLRFGFVYLLMALVLYRNRYLKIKKTVLFLETLVLGIAFFWSYDVCFYTVPAYLLFMVYESINPEEKLDFDFSLFSKRILTLIGFLCVIAVFIYADTWLKSGELPHWNYYFDYISLYQNGFGMMSLPESGYWWVIVGILYFSMFSIFSLWIQKFRTGDPLPKELNAIFFLTIYGIFQFFYYLARSHPNNLFHISMPSIFLTMYWLYYLRRFDPISVPDIFKKLGFSLVVIIIAVYVQPVIPSAQQKISEEICQISVFRNRIHLAANDMPRPDAYSKRVLSLMEKYSGNSKRLVYLLGDEDLNVSLYTGRLKTYPYNDWEQTNICPPALNRVLAFNPLLTVGDYIYYDLDQINHPDYSPTEDVLEKSILAHLNKSFEMKIIEKDQNLVVAKIIKNK